MNRTHSYSKREVLNSCLRQHFYEYYASAKRIPFDPERKVILRKLKELSGVFLLAGERLHWLIEQFLKKNLSRSWLKNTCQGNFDQAVRYSQDPETNQHLANSRYPPPMLLEYLYQDPSADELADRARKSLRQAVRNFFDDPIVTPIWQAVQQGDHWVEQRIRGLPKIDDFGVEGKVDLAGQDQRGIQIIDWKLGAKVGSEDSLQLLIYALWAEKEFSIKPDQVRVRRVYLGGPYVEEERSLDRDTLDLGRARLIQDIELMRELDPYGRAGNEEAFTPCEKENVCRQCKHQHVCPASKSGLTLRPTFVSLPVLSATD